MTIFPRRLVPLLAIAGLSSCGGGVSQTTPIGSLPVNGPASGGPPPPQFAHVLLAGYTGGDTGAYVKHHNPFAYFSDVLSDSAEAGNMVPFSQFAADLVSRSLPAYSFIVPDVNDDAHNCPAGLPSCADSQKLVAADQWLQVNIDPLVKTSAFQDSLLIITFDEGDVTDNAHGGGQVVTLIVSPKAKAGYKSTTLYQHESTLRLTMETLGVSDLPGAGASAPQMGEFFK